MTPEQQLAYIQAKMDGWYLEAADWIDDGLINRLHEIGTSGIMRDKIDAWAVRFSCLLTANELYLRNARKQMEDRQHDDGQ